MKDYYLVLASTPAYKKGEKLRKLIIDKVVYYGTDKKNKFHSKSFLDTKPELFEYVK
jgi:hypothetical protein